MKPEATHDRTPERGMSSREKARLGVALGAGALAVLFAVLNFDTVKVNWIFGTWRTPLVLVIAVSFLLGVLAGVLVWRRRTRAKPGAAVARPDA